MKIVAFLEKLYNRRPWAFLFFCILIIAVITLGLLTSVNESVYSTDATSTPLSVFTPSPFLNYQFGIATGDTLPWMSNDQLNHELDDLASLHVGQIRLDLAWDDIQPNNVNDFEWANFDRVVNAANARHIKLLPVLAYSPVWAMPAQCNTQAVKCPPADPSLFANFVKSAVTRYSVAGITQWEIWNEPNFKGTWQPGADPAAYVTLLKGAYQTIKSIEPTSTVVLGGLGPTATGNGNISPIDFLTQVYADGGKTYFDALGDHPYSFPAVPSTFMSWNAWSQMASTNPSIRGVMAKNGDSAKQVWITEYGAPTGGPGIAEGSATDKVFAGGPDHVTEALQAQMMADAIMSARADSWVGPFFWYSYQDIGTSMVTSENFFGIIRYDGSTKPAYQTLKDLLSQAY